MDDSAGWWQLERNRQRFRDLVVDANDGIIATAGVVEGLLSAGLSYRSGATAVLLAAVAGGVALGGSRYAEVAVERDALAELVRDEQRRLDLAPEEELAELAQMYEEKGLEPATAHEVAVQLSLVGALAAHVEEEHGIELDEPRLSPWVAALASCGAFAIGALVVMVTVAATPTSWRVPTTFIAVTIALALSSCVVARWGDVPLWRTVARTVGVGVATMAITFFVGSLVDL